MTRFIILVALICSSFAAGSASGAGQCVRGPGGACRGEDSAALLQGRMHVNEDEIKEVTESPTMLQQEDARDISQNPETYNIWFGASKHWDAKDESGSITFNRYR